MPALSVLHHYPIPLAIYGGKVASQLNIMLRMVGAAVSGIVSDQKVQEKVDGINNLAAS